MRIPLGFRWSFIIEDAGRGFVRLALEQRAKEDLEPTEAEMEKQVRSALYGKPRARVYWDSTWSEDEVKLRRAQQEAGPRVRILRPERRAATQYEIERAGAGE